MVFFFTDKYAAPCLKPVLHLPMPISQDYFQMSTFLPGIDIGMMDDTNSLKWIFLMNQYVKIQVEFKLLSFCSLLIHAYSFM